MIGGTKELGAKFLGQDLFFQFTNPSFYKTLQLLKDSFVNLIQRKQKQMEYLKEEVDFKRIENQLQSNQIKNKIQIIKTKLINQNCSDLPNAFWNRKNT